MKIVIFILISKIFFYCLLILFYVYIISVIGVSMRFGFSYIYSLDELPLKVKKSEIFSCGDKLIKIERLKIQKVSGIPIYKVSLDRNSFEKLKDRQQRKLLKIQVNENKKYFTVATVDVRRKIIEIFKSFNIRI